MLTTERLDFPAFSKAGDAWSDLVSACTHPLPFMSHPWICTWWRHFGSGHGFAALIVRDGDRWLAGLPLAIRRLGIGPARVAVAEIAGTGPVPTRGMGLADKADLVVRRGRIAAGQRLVAALGDLLGAVDVIHLKGLDRRASVGGRLIRDAGALVGHRSSSPYLPLARDPDALLRERSRNLRKTLRKRRNALAAAGRAEIARLESGDDPRAWMAEVLAVSRSSWQAERGSDLFRHPDLRAFFVDLVPALAARGWLDLHLLRIDGRARAFELGMDFGGRVFSYTGAYDRSVGHLSPGSVLTAEVIAGACRRGRAEYDFLRGAEGYKRSWTDLEREELEGLLRTDAPGARLYEVAVRVKRRLKARPWLTRLDERLTGLSTRWRHGG